LQVINRVRLTDPASGLDATMTDETSASPTIGPDGDVYYGVLENPFPLHNNRGWLLHFNSDLSQQKIPGGFGWDDTASIVDASLVASYHGTSKYLIMTKYNNYANVFIGDGHNRIAILDPNTGESDPVIPSANVMREVITTLGVTPDPENLQFFPGAVREWCINTAAVDPFTKSVIVNSEDGKLYRWDLTTNQLSEVIKLSGGIGEAYTPTIIGADGTVYAIKVGCDRELGDKSELLSGAGIRAPGIRQEDLRLNGICRGSGSGRTCLSSCALKCRADLLTSPDAVSCLRTRKDLKLG
jgi:hypothetical protein